MEPDGLVLACATTAEARAARRAGLRTALVGLRGVNGVPDGDVVSYGLAGCIRAISDTPTRRLGGVARGAKPNGEVDVRGFLRGFLAEPVLTVRAALGARRALKALEAIA